MTSVTATTARLFIFLYTSPLHDDGFSMSHGDVDSLSDTDNDIYSESESYGMSSSDHRGYVSGYSFFF